MKESDILHESGSFFVIKDTDCYSVYRNVGCYSQFDSAYHKTQGGLSIAIARCNYLNNPKIRYENKTMELI